MHNAAFTTLGIDATYALRPTDESGVDALLAELRRGAWQGLNVTTPLKQVLAAHVELSGAAVRARAINTVWRQGRRVCGALTDVQGIREPLAAMVAGGGDAALVLGAGGAARAAVIALDELGYAVHVAARRIEAATAVLTDVAPQRAGRALALADRAGLTDLFGSSLAVIIQATPVGQSGDTHVLPWREAGSSGVAFDLVYRPRLTPFLLDATAAGWTPLEGWQMLLAQGAHSFALWTGQRPPIPVMRDALLVALAG